MEWKEEKKKKHTQELGEKKVSDEILPRLERPLLLALFRLNGFLKKYAF